MDPHGHRLAAASHRPMLVALVLCLLLPLVGCTTEGDGAIRDARDSLGTIVTITAYGSDEAAIRATIDEAYTAMGEIESALDSHSPTSTISMYNHHLGNPPTELSAVVQAISRLGVQEWFSIGLGAVVESWGFETGGRIPNDEELDAAMSAGRLDAGGASKGLALDVAVEVLRANEDIDAALVSAGSTTVTLGEKPDGEPWRIGIEDPRDPSAVVATIEATGSVTVSTSGDYQRYFERDGVRYHHILDPRTGRPATGVRSLTIVGAASGLDSDILSTALFVAGATEAERYATDAGLALYLIDDEGRTLVVPDPQGLYPIEAE